LEFGACDLVLIPNKGYRMKETILKVYVQPKSSKNEIVGPYRDGIKVKVTAPPAQGKANGALRQFLAKALRIPPSQIEILKGHRSREKTLKIEGIDGHEILDPFGGAKPRL
jgi:uncharacterized protein (TIGR00251 family)